MAGISCVHLPLTLRSLGGLSCMASDSDDGPVIILVGI